MHCVVIGGVEGIDFDLAALHPVVVVILNKRDFEAVGVFRPGDGQDEEHQDKPAAFYLVEFIAGYVEVGEVVVGRADFGEDIVLGGVRVFVEGKVGPFQGGQRRARSG